MPIIIKLLFAVCLLIKFTHIVSIGDTFSEENAASADKTGVIWGNDEHKTHTKSVDRTKRTTAKLKDALDSLLGKPLTDRLDSSLLGSIRNSPLLKSKTSIPSLLDSYKSTLDASIASRINLLGLNSRQSPAQTVSSFPMPSPHLSQPAAAAAATTPQLAMPLAPVYINCGNGAFAPSAPPFPNAPPINVASAQRGVETLATLVSTNDETVGESKPIVLPEYLMDKDDKKPKKKTSNNRITTQQLNEARELRNAINYAVQHRIYAHSSSEVKNMNQKQASQVNTQIDDPPYEQPGPYEQPPPSPVTEAPQFYPFATPSSFQNLFSDFWTNLIGRKSPIKHLLGSAEPSVGSARSDFSYVPDTKSMDPSPQEYASNSYSDIENDSDGDGIVDDGDVDKMMAKVAERIKSEGIISNAVDSYVNNDEVPHIEVSQTRDELNMTSISEDMNFEIGEKVIRWQTLQRNKRESHALIGMTNSSILLVYEKNGVFTLKSELQLLSKPTSFAIFTFWNQTQHSIDGIVIVSIQHEIVFYGVNEAMDKMEFIWMWPTNQIARHIQHFVIDNSDTLLVITNTLASSSGTLYRFDMNKREFFLRETLSLESRAQNAALIQTGHETFLCFPQYNHTVIYKHVNQNFKFFSTIESNEADTVTSFEMGGYSYLAIGGHQPKILRYFHGNFFDQTILSGSWGFVEFFLPVSARTYRDDLILFVQHRLDFDSHTHSFVEALIWNGQAFHPALQVPCYFGDVESNLGLSCIMDQDRHLGIIGATTFQRNRTISIIVPRHEAPSGLFDLQIDLLPAVSNINEHLLEVLSEVIILLETHDQVLKEAREIIDQFPKDPVDEIVIKDQNIDIIYTEELDLGSNVPVAGIFFNDEQITKEIADELYELVDEADALLKEYESTNRAKRANSIKSLHLRSVNVTDLYVDNINGVSTGDFIYIENGNLAINGPLAVKSIRANHVERIPEELNLRLETPETTVIDGDLEIDEINGIKWKDLMNQIVFKHLPIHLDELQVTGTVFANNSIFIQNLNGLSFPNDYVFTDGTDQIVITGKKTFKNLLVTEAVDCFGTLNGIEPSQIVTLSGAQEIPGTITFRHLEITEELVVGPNGTITGRHLDEFLANPTLRETTLIHANSFINSLEVNGNVYVTSIDDVFVDDILSDVVYKHETSPTITSFKRFSSLQSNIQIVSGLVNDIPFSSFVTKDTEQVFNVSNLHGDVFFQHLTLDGLFNFVNVTDLDMNAIKLFGDQYTNAELEFQDGDHINIEANEFIILDTINDQNVNDFINIDEDFELHGDVTISELNVDELIIDGDIIGGPGSTFNGMDLQNLHDTHLSRNQPQNITAPVRFGTVTLRNGFDANFINGFDFKEVVDILSNWKTNEQLLSDPTNVIVDRMIVNGSVWLEEINGLSIEELKQNAIRLDESNVIDFPIVFLDPVYINGNMNVVELNGENFDNFVTDLVRKSANTTRIYGTTIFEEDVTVLEDVNVATVNEIPVENILTKNFKGTIWNPVEIVGNVFVPNLIVEGSLNGVSADELNAYIYDESSGTHFLHQDVFFNDSISIRNLVLHGGYNDIANVAEHIANLVRTDRPAVISGTIRFTVPVHFNGHIDINEFNGINLHEFLSNIVLIDQTEPVEIHSDVIFEKPVVFTNLHITGDLITETINNCSITRWVQDTIRTDQPFTFNGSITFPPGTFEATNINTQYFNDILMDDVLTLNTPQHFTQHVHLDAVYSTVPIIVDGLVNGYNLQEERANTLMTFGTQNIETPTIFQSIRVLKDLTTNGPVNGRDLRLAVPLEGDIFIDSPISFSTVQVDRLYTNHLISGINFDTWYESSLQRWKPTSQIVTAPWHIQKATVDTFIAEKGVNGMSAEQFIQNWSASKQSHQQNFIDKCHLANELINGTQKHVIFLSHLDKSFSIDTPNSINSIHLLNAFHQNYLIVNSGCETYLYVWSFEKKTFEPLSTVITGDVVQWIHVEDLDGEVFLISNNDGSIDSTCSIGGAFIWKLDPNVKLLIQVVQFGQIANFKSMQIKPNSHAFFYVLRNADHHVVEYNLRGAIVKEWNLNDDVAPITTSVRFVPHEANLGLALSTGDKLSILNTCDCTKRRKRCSLLQAIGNGWNKLKSQHRQKFDKTVSQLHTDLHNGRTVLKSILMSNELNKPINNTYSTFTQTRINYLKDLMDKSREKTSQILSAIWTPFNMTGAHNMRLFPIAANRDGILSQTQRTSATIKTTTTTTTPSPPPEETLKSNINGELIVNMMDAIDNAVERDKSSTDDIVAAISGGSQQEETDPQDEMVGTGADMADLMDLIEKVIEQNQEKFQHLNGFRNDDTNENVASQFNRTEMKQMLNDSLILNELLSISNTTNQTDTRVGTLFGIFMLEKTLTQTFSKASQLLLGEDEEENGARNANDEDGSVVHHGKSGLINSLLDVPQRLLSGDLQHHLDISRILDDARGSKLRASKSMDETQVGDAFGDILFKLTPIADSIFNKMVNEMRKRNRVKPNQNDPSVGATHTEIIQLNESEIVLKNGSRPQFRRIDVIFILELIDAVDTNINNNNSQSENQVGSGASLVNLMDFIDEVIQKNREKHRKSGEYRSDEEYQPIVIRLNRTELSQLLNASIHLHEIYSKSNDSARSRLNVGSIFGGLLLERSLADSIEKASDSLFHDDILDSPQTIKSNDSIDHILTMISHAENITLNAKLNEIGDEFVGADAFGDLMFKLTPFMDKIMDKITAELQRRDRAGYYGRDAEKVGSVLDTTENTNVNPDSSEMSSATKFFKKVGKSVVKAYVFGKNHFRHVQNIASEVKHLYDFYHGHFHNNDTNNEHGTKSPLEPGNHTPDSKQSKFKKEMTLITKLMPNAKEFAESFAVEMIKSFTNPTKSGSTKDLNFWQMVKNGVNAAFDKHIQTTGQPSKFNDPDVDKLIFKVFMQEIGKQIKTQQIEAENNDEQVESSLSEMTTNEPTVGGPFDVLFDKLVPLIDHLSERIVDELREREYEERSRAHQPNNAEKSEHQSTPKTNDNDATEHPVAVGSSNEKENIDSYTEKSVDATFKDSLEIMNLSRESSGNDENVGTGAGLVNIMDLIDKVIEENKEKHKPNYDTDNYNENAYPVASEFDESEMDQHESDAIEHEPTVQVTNQGLTEILHSSHESADFSNESIEHILNMISHAEKISLADETSRTDDELVGDGFGDLSFKLTPFIDKIMDKVTSELQKRDRAGHDTNKVGSAQNSNDTTDEDKSTKSSVTNFFKNVGKSLVKVYIFGKDRFRHVHSMANDAKHLYDIYHGHFYGNETGENTTDSPPKPHKNESADNEDSTQLKNKKEMNLITKLIPNAKEFASSFAVEMIKSFVNHQKPENNTNNYANFWPMIRNGVKTAFETHINSTDQSNNVDNDELDELIFMEFMHEINETVKNQPSESEDKEEHVGMALNEENESKDSIVGGFDVLMMKLSPLIDHLSEKIVDELRQRQERCDDEYDDADVSAVHTTPSINEDNVSTNQQLFESLKSSFESKELNAETVKDILRMIAKAENITWNEVTTKADDEFVGADAFGDLMFKLTPFMDKIMDKITTELQRRDHNGYYARDQVGSIHETGDKKGDEDISSKTNRFFRKMGKALTKVYVFGKDRVKNAKTFANDLKFLFNTYYLDNVIEDNQNDNRTYGPTEPPPTPNNESELSKSDSTDINPNKKLTTLDKLHQKEMQLISKMIPKQKEFNAAFTVEVVKSLLNEATSSANKSVNNNVGFWPVIKNAVNAAFEMRTNHTDRKSHLNETELNRLIFKDVLHRINETMQHEMTHSSDDSEGNVGSVQNEAALNEHEDPLVGDTFDHLFNKFTPLIDHLSDKIVNKLQRSFSVESDEENPQDPQISQAGMIPNNNTTFSGCERNITMEDFVRKLNDMKQFYGSNDMFGLMSSLNPTRNDNGEEKLGSDQSHELESTVVSIPNLSQPSHRNGEIIAMRVGVDQQLLVAVSSITENTIKSDHDRIQIFEDVIDGKLFQTISCFKPRSLTTFTVNTDTILAFIQDESEVKAYIFRGNQGFVEFTSFGVPSPIKQMTHFEVTAHPLELVCPEHYLILTLDKQVIFLQAVTVGDCRINENLRC